MKEAKNNSGIVEARLAIVGAGPAGVLSLILLLASWQQSALTGVNLTVHLIDPYGNSGGKVWNQDQSSHLRMNIPPFDLSFFGRCDNTGLDTTLQGPDLYTWAKSENLSVSASSYAARSLGGDYICWKLNLLK